MSRLKWVPDGYRNSFANLWGYTNSVQLAPAHLDERGTIFHRPPLPTLSPTPPAVPSVRPRPRPLGGGRAYLCA